MKRRLIEYDMPLEEISNHARHEKNIHIGLPPQFHLWWARRPLSSSRATSIAALLEDPGPTNQERRNQLLELIADSGKWESVKAGPTHSINELTKKLREEYGEKGAKVLDPFSGGGSIPLEAARFGCRTNAIDLNPVSVLLQKGTYEWPSRFNIRFDLPEQATEGPQQNLPGEKVPLLNYLFEKWALQIINECKDELQELYPLQTGKNLSGSDEGNEAKGWIPVSYLWARTIPCQNPNCDATLPLHRQYWLSRKKGRKTAIRPSPAQGDTDVKFELLHGEELEQAMKSGFDPTSGSVHRGDAKCPVCHQVTEAKSIRSLAQKGAMEQQLVAVAYHHPDYSGKKYRIAKDSDRETFLAAQEQLKKKLRNWPYLDSPLPTEPLPSERAVGNSGFRILLYGFRTWSDLFNDRQKLSLVTILEKIKGSYQDIEADCETIVRELNQKGFEIEADSLADAVIGLLGLLLDRQADFSSNLCSWHNNAELSAHLFDMKAIPMTWDYSEVYPFSDSTGSIQTQLYYMMAWLKSGTSSFPESSEVSVEQGSATSLPFENETFDAVLTDPPYYDNVAYGDLSDYFYVWLKRAVGDRFPDLFSTPLVPKTEEAIVDKDRGKEEDFFEESLSRAFSEMHRVLKPGGIAVVVYAHKTTEGWETLLNSLLDSGFVVTASWPIHTEMKSRLVAARSASLSSSIYMACRKTNQKEVGFWNRVSKDIESAVETKLSQFWNEGVVGGDFFISAIGPGMEEYSKYERVEKYSGEPVDTGELLRFIRGICADFLVKRLLKETSSEAIDKEAMFYLTYRWTFMDNKVEFDDALRLAKAEGVRLEEVWKEGGFVKKTRKYIRVQGPEDRQQFEEIDNMVDAMHRASNLWGKGDHSKLDTFLNSTGYGEDPAFWQFCQAVAECLTNGNKEKQLLEGLLMSRDHRMQTEGETDDHVSSRLDDFNSGSEN